MAAVFLDLDGTLIDPAPGILGSVSHALRALDLPVPAPEALRWVIGPALIDSFARLGAAEPERALALYRERFGAGAMFDCTVYPGIPAALDRLAAAGHRLYLATAKPRDFAVQITRRMGLDRHLAAQFGPDMDGTLNDKADLLRHALTMTGEAAETAVMIGDRSHDIAAAHANEMAAIAVEWGFGTETERAVADARCAAPGDVPATVDRVLSRSG